MSATQEIVDVSTIATTGRATSVPKPVREALGGIEPGDKLAWYKNGNDELIVVKL